MNANRLHSQAIPMLAVGQASRAIEFYVFAFRAEETHRITSDDGRIEHAELRIGEARIMIADEFPGHNVAASTLGGTPVIIYLYVDDAEEALQRAADLGATVLRPVQSLPHGDRVGKLRDPFGHVWMIATPLA